MSIGFANQLAIRFAVTITDYTNRIASIYAFGRFICSLYQNEMQIGITFKQIFR